MAKIDMTGWIMKEHGFPESKIIVIEEDKDYKKEKGYTSTRVYYKCSCACGALLTISGEQLRKGKLSCGCEKSLIGKIFGKLKVIEQAENSSQNEKQWLCNCECGKQVIVSSSNLKNQKIKSCGCSRYQFVSEKNSKNLINQKFGKLTVLNKETTNKKGVYWRCLCDCGNEITLSSTSLLSGKRTSCGCISSSLGEENIKNILQKNNIDYIFNSDYFQDLILPSGYKGRYDFILLQNNEPFRLIEFDGEQHFKRREYFQTQEEFEYRQQCDRIKDNYAKEHNLPLVRIPYWEKTKITLDMLLGDKYLL